MASPFRFQGTAFALAALLLATRLVSAVESPADRLQLPPRQIAFDGWGTSLCWFANEIGRWPEPQRAAIADALFSKAGLGFTVVRYNIGGGENPEHHHMLAFRQIEGFEPQPGQWDWNADPGQRWMLNAAIARGASVLEAFSNSPPYWMTLSACASGGADPNADNLDPKAEAAFVDYLVAVIEHFQKAWGIRFQTLDPFNEPYTDYWKLNGRQEGCHFERSTQARILRSLRAALDAHGLKDVAISASDETNYERAIGSFESYDAATRACVAQINAHAYATNRRSDLRRLAEAAGKPLVMSEVDGAGGAVHDHRAIGPALELAGRIVDDFRDLQPRRWVFWQAIEDEKAQAGANKNWGLIHADLQGATHTWSFTKKYYAMAQFSKFIRPGAVVLPCADPQTIVTYHPRDRELVIVVRNAADEEKKFRYLVSNLVNAAAVAHVYRTSATEDLNELEQVPATDGVLDVEARPQSITTVVLRDHVQSEFR